MFSLYIDPGTGSMLFSLVIGLVATLTFGLRALFVKIRFGFNKKDISEEKDVIPYVIFSDHKRYWNIFRPIVQEFEKRGVDVVYYTLSSDDPALSCGMKHIKAEYLGEGNKPFAKLNFLNADTLGLSIEGLDVSSVNPFSGEEMKIEKDEVQVYSDNVYLVRDDIFVESNWKQL